MVSALLNGILRRRIAGLSLLGQSCRSCRLPIPLYRLDIALLDWITKGCLLCLLHTLRISLRLLRHISICRLHVASIRQICLAVTKGLIHIHLGSAKGFPIADFLDGLQSTANTAVSSLVEGEKIDADAGITTGIYFSLIINIVAGEVYNSGLPGGGCV